MPGMAASGAGAEAVRGLGERVAALVEQYIKGGWAVQPGGMCAWGLMQNGPGVACLCVFCRLQPDLPVACTPTLQPWRPCA